MIFLLPIMVSGQTCRSVTCEKLSNEFTCIQADSSSLKIQECDNSMFSYCPFTDFSTNSTCVSLPTSPFNTSWPSDPCESNSTCVSNFCKDSICQGILSSNPCNDTGQCMPRYRCSAGYCKSLVLDN